MSGAGRAARPLRALVVDDSSAARAEIERVVVEGAGAELAGTAEDGEAALALALRLRPDVVILDLRMPRLDGFTFLRLLMAHRPTPVVVVSSSSARRDVFKALELGALDFVEKPETTAAFPAFRAELLAKVAVVRSLRLGNLAPRAVPEVARRGPIATIEPPRVAVVGASTGGPQALRRLLAALPGDLPLGVLVAQHMPARFTRTFAERLAHATRFSVQEAEDGDLVAAGRVLVAPGGRNLALRRDPGPEGALRAEVSGAAPDAPARHVPSVDVLLASAARALGPRACGVVLTGMGSDGTAGLAAIRAAGGLTLAESEETAVVYGMPQAAAASGAVDELLALDRLAARLVRFARTP